MPPSDASVHRSPKDTWEIARSQLRLQMIKGTYETWVRDTMYLAHEDGIFVIGVSNAYARDWLSLRLRPLIKRTLASIVGHAVDVSFVVQPVPVVDEDKAAPAPLLSLALSVEEPESEQPLIEGVSLNPQYTFENFIVGSSNRMAHAVALSIAEHPGGGYSPLFLYGESGLGKTHLLQAIGKQLRDSGRQVLYVTSEHFTNELISAIRTQSTDRFRAKYRTSDVLLIDDVHFIAGKEQTQEEFFHTFNELHSASRQIVLSSDRPPQAIPTLEERLRTRFGWGMIADVQPPNLETRIAILQAKAASMGQEVSSDVLQLIAQRARRNIRDLEGALNNVLAQAALLNRPLNTALVVDALAYLCPTQPRLSLDDIRTISAKHFGVSVEDLTGRARSAKIARQRQIVMYVMREETGASLPQIGQALGGRDHTTIIHGYDKIARELEGDSDMGRQVADLRNSLYEPVRVR